MKIRIILADDHKIVRDGLRNLLNKENDIEVIAETSNGRETVDRTLEFEPDIVIMDIAMPELNGIQATQRITAETGYTRVIALSMHSDRQFVNGMFQAGASGYLLKDCAIDELVSAVRTVHSGRLYLSPDISGIVVQELIAQMKKSANKDKSDLSNREKEILQLIAEGKTTKQIADSLYISVKTVETHRKKIMTKLNLYSVPELTKYAIRVGLTSLEN